MNQTEHSAEETNQEGTAVNDKAIELLEQYEIEVLRTRKGRGAIVCDTDKGCLIFREYSGSQDRIGDSGQAAEADSGCGTGVRGGHHTQQGGLAAGQGHRRYGICSEDMAGGPGMQCP